MNAGCEGQAPTRWGALFLWLPVVLYTAFIFWLSSAPRPIPGMDRFPHIDKLFHAVEYLPLGTLLQRALRRSLPRARSRSVWTTGALGAIGVGTLDEIYQSFIPRRFSSAWDLLFDGLGALCGQFLYSAFRRKLANTP